VLPWRSTALAPALARQSLARDTCIEAPGAKVPLNVTHAVLDAVPENTDQFVIVTDAPLSLRTSTHSPVPFAAVLHAEISLSTMPAPLGANF